MIWAISDATGIQRVIYYTVAQERELFWSWGQTRTIHRDSYNIRNWKLFFFRFGKSFSWSPNNVWVQLREKLKRDSLNQFCWFQRLSTSFLVVEFCERFILCALEILCLKSFSRFKFFRMGTIPKPVGEYSSTNRFLAVGVTVEHGERVSPCVPIVYLEPLPKVSSTCWDTIDHKRTSFPLCEHVSQSAIFCDHCKNFSRTKRKHANARERFSRTKRKKVSLSWYCKFADRVLRRQTLSQQYRVELFGVGVQWVHFEVFSRENLLQLCEGSLFLRTCFTSERLVKGFQRVFLKPTADAGRCFQHFAKSKRWWLWASPRWCLSISKDLD